MINLIFPYFFLFYFTNVISSTWAVCIDNSQLTHTINSLPTTPYKHKVSVGFHGTKRSSWSFHCQDCVRGPNNKLRRNESEMSRADARSSPFTISTCQQLPTFPLPTAIRWHDFQGYQYFCALKRTNDNPRLQSRIQSEAGEKAEGKTPHSKREVLQPIRRFSSKFDESKIMRTAQFIWKIKCSFCGFPIYLLLWKLYL